MTAVERSETESRKACYAYPHLNFSSREILVSTFGCLSNFWRKTAVLGSSQRENSTGSSDHGNCNQNRSQGVVTKSRRFDRQSKREPCVGNPQTAAWVHWVEGGRRASEMCPRFAVSFLLFKSKEYSMICRGSNLLLGHSCERTVHLLIPTATPSP